MQVLCAYSGQYSASNLLILHDCVLMPLMFFGSQINILDVEG